MLQRSRLHAICFAITFLLFSTVIVHGLEIPAASRYRINDFASVLELQTKEQLESKVRIFEKETTTQIVVAIFPSLEDESQEDFVNRMFIAWKIGQKKNNNGVLLAIFTKDRKVRIEVGYGLEGRLTDAISSRIIRKELVPELKAGNYGRGIDKTIDAITKVVRSEYTTPDPQRSENLRLALAIIFLLVPLIVMLAMGTRKKRGSNSRHGNDWSSGSDFGNSSGGDWSSGGSGGGDFSGGGGSSGGGGASDSW